MNDELKELLSHIRTIHFTMMGAGFAILVVVSLGRDASLQNASDQLARIAGLNSALTTSSISKAMLTASQSGLPDGLSVHEERGKVLWRVDGVNHPITENEQPLPWPKLWIPSASNAYSPPYNYSSSISVAPESRTIRDFQAAWQFLLNGRRAFGVSAFHPENAVFRNDENLAPGTPVYPESIELIGLLPK